MLRFAGRIGLCLLFAVLVAYPSRAAKSHRRHHPAGRAPSSRLQARPLSGNGYGLSSSPTPDCRYADGTPFDPDIIGGPNHVGDGGPAVNLGGFPPCGY